MADDRCIILLCLFSCLCCVIGELNLPEESACVTEGFNGTCIDLFKCPTAALTYLYAKAGFQQDRFPKFPEVCSYKDNEPIVCCTDCSIGVSLKNQAVGPLGKLKNKMNSVAKTKCYEYFEKLPYKCRGIGNVGVKKEWKEERKCHEFDYSIAFAVGGRNAERWEFPHMALIGYGDDVKTAQWLCGGTVISERFILTAAHCTSTRALGNISFAALGILKRSDPVENWKIYKIKRIIIHPEYKAPSKYHDIALLETDTEIAFGKDLLPACLNIDEGFNHNGEAPGWGRLGHRQALADTLQVVKLEAFNASECAEIYHPHRHLKYGYDHEKQMCYGHHTKIIDTCEGDSGGPLQYNQDHIRCLFSVVGVTSYGKNCGILGSAGMYTRVSYYVSWIESVVWPEETEAKRKKDNLWLDKLFKSS
ncbi:hypothetical protein PYW08_010782 [Mythimna loreyi]|uniref:Uncharacterized protein n=1 Tax=Mythimna loreyi TaxID=667449 RepID=A0ACC2Q7N3_9NEOP|nr:hypothetical protein PYW08_010782 [Mythimna loreyi]